MAQFYKAIVQAVLLYCSETWTLTSVMVRRLEGFQNRILRHLTGEHIRPQAEGEIERTENGWYYPDMDEVRRSTGVRLILEYLNDQRTRLWESMGRTVKW